MERKLGWIFGLSTIAFFGFAALASWRDIARCFEAGAAGALMGLGGIALACAGIAFGIHMIRVGCKEAEASSNGRP